MYVDFTWEKHLCTRNFVKDFKMRTLSCIIRVGPKDIASVLLREQQREMTPRHRGEGDVERVG